MIKSIIFFSLLIVSKLAFAISADVSVCFTPADRCDTLIISSIEHAKSAIDVQAYQLTSKPIIEALARAYDAGIDVKVILDKSQTRQKRFCPAIYLKDHHVPVFVDFKPAIAHNKIMIIDDSTVITGSYNFTKNAQYRNAENLVIINSHAVAHEYVDNFYRRLKLSRSY